MTTKLRIDLRAGVLEVEGAESFVKEIYHEFKERLSVETKSGRNIKEGGKKDKPDKKSPQKSTGKESYAIIKDLNLFGKGTGVSLKDFYNQKKPSISTECNAVFIYYLKKTLNLENISLDHVYTCYKEVNKKMPNAFKQSLIDTSNKKGWIDTKNISDILLTLKGENFVEHDLPRAEKS